MRVSDNEQSPGKSVEIIDVEYKQYAAYQPGAENDHTLVNNTGNTLYIYSITSTAEMAGDLKAFLLITSPALKCNCLAALRLYPAH